MSRPLRIEYNNAVYHITARGNERKNIFLDDEDFKKFLCYIGVVYERYRIIVCRLKQIRIFLGNSISEVAVSKLFSRLHEEPAKNADLKRDLERIEMAILDNLDMYQVKTFSFPDDLFVPELR